MSLVAGLRRAELEDDDAEVLVQPGLLVRVAAAVLPTQLWFDRGLDLEAGAAKVLIMSATVPPRWMSVTSAFYTLA